MNECQSVSTKRNHYQPQNVKQLLKRLYVLSLQIVGTISKPTNFTVNFYNNDYAVKGRREAKKDLFKQFIIYGFVNAAD